MSREGCACVAVLGGEEKIGARQLLVHAQADCMPRNSTTSTIVGNPAALSSCDLWLPLLPLYQQPVWPNPFKSCSHKDVSG